MKKKILFVVMSIEIGGIETFLMNILKNINHEKYQIDFLLWDQKEGFYESAAKKYGANIYKIKISHSLGKDIKTIMDFFNNNKYDIVHINSHFYSACFAYAASRCKIKKIITHAHANSDNSGNGIKRRLYRFICRHMINKYSTDFCACSKEAAKYVFGKNNKKFIVINNCIDVSNYITINNETIEAIKQKYKISKNDIILGNVGHLSVEKNQEFLLKIMERLVSINPNYKLMLIGDGKLKNELLISAKTKKIEDNIIFVGNVSNVMDYLKVLNIFLFPSLYEGFGMALLESQASGIFSLASDHVPLTTNMDLGLVEYLPIGDENINIWINAIVNYKQITIKPSEIFNNIYSKGFDVSNIVEVIERIYQ